MSNKQLTCLIIDDNRFARETLADLLERFSQIKLIKSIGESKLAIRDIAIHQPDIVFLDIEMPEKSGFQIHQEIIELKLNTKVVFVTSHEEFVVDAFKNQAFDFLTKPLKLQDLKETIENIQNSISQEPIIKDPKLTKKIILKNARGRLILNSEDILYIEADGSYTNIYLTEGHKEVISKNIGALEELFTDDSFFKVSRSHIINTSFLQKIDRVKRKVVIKSPIENLKIKASREKLYDLESFLSAMD